MGAGSGKSPLASPEAMSMRYSLSSLSLESAKVAASIGARPRRGPLPGAFSIGWPPENGTMRPVARSNFLRLPSPAQATK